MPVFPTCPAVPTPFLGQGQPLATQAADKTPSSVYRRVPQIQPVAPTQRSELTQMSEAAISPTLPPSVQTLLFRRAIPLCLAAYSTPHLPQAQTSASARPRRRLGCTSSVT